MSDLDWHREMLADRHRVQAFGQAAREAVSPGDVVVDFGTGTGLLALSQHRTLGLWADPDRLLAPGSARLRCDFHRDTPAVLRGEVNTSMARSGFLRGWVSWFVARYGGVPFLNTRPPIDGSSWENVFFPTGDSVAVSAGDKAAMRLRRDNPLRSWESQVAEGEVRVFGEIHGVPARDLVPRDD